MPARGISGSGRAEVLTIPLSADFDQIAGGYAVPDSFATKSEAQERCDIETLP